MRNLILAALAALAVIGCNKIEGDGTPQIKPENDDVINIPAEGGSFQISYTLENPVEGGLVSAETEQTEWISDIDCSNIGEVAFTVAANSAEMRNGSITVKYTYGDSEVSFKANLIQAGAAAGGAPVIQPESDNVTVFAEGGLFQINYTIANPVADGKISATADDSWISNIDCSTENVISFKVESYTKADPRETTMTIDYTYPDGKTSKYVTITQEASDNPSDYDIDIITSDFSGYYYGDDYSAGLANYFINLSDIGYDASGYIKPNGKYAKFDIYSTTFANDDNIILPEGTYTYTGKKADGTMSSMSIFYTTDANSNIKEYPFEEGTLTVTRQGNDYNFDFAGVATDGTTIHLSYTGPQTLEDRRKGNEETTESTVVGDFEASFNGGECTASYYGESNGKSCWHIELVPKGGLGHGFLLDIYSSRTTGFGYIPTGTFTADDADNYYIPGTISDGKYLDGTMLLLYELENNITGFSLIKSGDITITKESNGTYTIVFDNINDKGNLTTGTWNGTLNYQDHSNAPEKTAKPLVFE